MFCGPPTGLGWGIGGRCAAGAIFFDNCSSDLTDFYHFCMIPDVFLAFRNHFFTLKHPEIGKGLNFLNGVIIA